MAEKSLKATKTRIICKKKERKEHSDGGIYIGSNQTSEHDQWAVVLDVGPDVTADIRVGDDFVPQWNTVAVIIIDKEKFYVCDETNILGILR